MEATSVPPDSAAVHADDPRRKVVEQALKRCQYRTDALIEVLHVAQETYGFLGDELLAYIAARLKLPESQVFGVATFYHAFKLRPKGEHTCIVCTGTACYVKGAGDIVRHLESVYGIQAGQTTANGRLSLGTARCLGTCSLAPLLMVDSTVLGKETVEEVAEHVEAALTGSHGKGESSA